MSLSRLCDSTSHQVENESTGKEYCLRSIIGEIKSDSNIFSTRRRLLWNGSISVVLAFDFDLDLHLPIKLSHNGITEGKSELEWVSEVKDDIEETVYNLSKNQLTDDKIIEDKVRSSIRSVTKLFFNIKPLIDVHIIRGL